MQSSNLFEGLIFLLACSVHFVRGRFGRLLWDSVEIAQNRRRTKCTEHARKKVRSSKRLFSDLFFARISGRNFLPELCGKVRPGPALSKLCAVQFCSTEQSTFRGGRKGEKGVASKEGKRKKGRVKTGQFWCPLTAFYPVQVLKELRSLYEGAEPPPSTG